jgi:hypothetical protein
MQRFIEQRIRTHIEAQEATMRGDEPPFCTDEERWTRPGKFAVMKAGRKAALRLFDDKKDAKKYIADQHRTTKFGPKYHIVQRENRYIRCDEGYCPVVKWCGQRMAELLTQTITNGVNDDDKPED